MRVMITGGAGYVGLDFVRRLSAQPEIEEILVYDNLSRGNHNILLFPGPANAVPIRLIRGDILDLRRLRMALAGVDVVCHLAARVTTPYSDEGVHIFEQVNHWGTAELVAALEDTGVGHLIFLSSAAVYGYADAPVTEHTPPNPKSYYGASKLRAEGQCRRLMERMAVSILRCGNVYGFGAAMRFDAVINRMLVAAHLGEPLTIEGDGDQVRAFIHIGTLIETLSRLVLTPTPGVYNLAEVNASIGQVETEIRKLYPHCQTLRLNQHIEPRHLSIALGSTLNNRLNLPTTDLAAGLGDISARLALTAR
ncbi:NAD(P)-dependent oxidoreductase [Thiohalocapsa sp. ML1]|uniref:NAD-dependent epimerase/dehydratase family protein n=1 Tax=Thiohalocapsa sp. ML1 TaxID=1431688 RepID=UPI00138F37CA|nr:SDR family oxidoreductase [Thiohalocapsa sp. ML1]